ncbi:hypothetical protein ACGF3G_50390 [Streptomyces sp. NPDC048179]|uniref:hypothetical protein n=1 Tax=Streptomyces sp. NPDC048179 TaxID=3365506 RepID=UPI003720B09F
MDQFFRDATRFLGRLIRHWLIWLGVIPSALDLFGAYLGWTGSAPWVRPATRVWLISGVLIAAFNVWREDATSPSPRPAVVVNNAPGVDRPLGRLRQLTRLSVETLVRRTRVIVLEGQVGSGRTTLALHLMNRLDSSLIRMAGAVLPILRPPRLMIHVDLYPSRGLIDEMVRQTSTMLDLVSLRHVPNDEVVAELNRQLRKRRTLMVVDGIHGRQDIMDDVHRLIAGLPTSTTIVLISPPADLPLATVITLPQLPPRTARRVVRRSARRLGLRAFTRASQWGVVAAGHGNPLALVWLVARAARSVWRQSDLVRGITDGSSEVLRKLFDTTWTSLGEVERRVVELLALAGGSMDETVLQKSSGCSNDRFLDTCEGLVRTELISFVPKAPSSGGEARRVVAQQLFGRYVLNLVQNDHDLVKTRVTAASGHYISYFSDNSPTGPDGYATASAEPEIEGALTIAKTCASVGELRSCVALLAAMEELVFVCGFWDIRLDIAQTGVQAATELDDHASVAHFLVIGAGVHLLRNNYEEAERRLGAAEREAHLALGTLQLGRWRRTLALFQERTGLLDEAFESVDAAESWSAEAGDTLNVVDCVWLRGQLLLSAGASVEVLEGHYREMVRLARQAGWRRAEGFGLARLSAAVLAQHRKDEAASLIQEARQVAEEFRDPRLQVTCLLLEAAVEHLKGRHRRSVALQKEAEERARQLGIEPSTGIRLDFTSTG